MDVAVRTDGDAAALAPAFQQALSRIDRTVPLGKVRTMDDVLAASIADRRFNLFLLGGFALLALALATAGTFGVMSYSVSQRTREIGVRLALGARPSAVFRLVVGRAVALAACGALAGMLAALALSHLIADLLFQVTPTDAVTFAGAAGVLVAAAVLASYWPARRAARVDPLIALRSE